MDDQESASTATSPLPEIIFWNKAAPQVKFINASDFHRDDLLGRLGLRGLLDLSTSFGTYDPEEIRRRQRLMEMFLKHPKIRQEVLGMNQHSWEIPRDETQFLREFPREAEHNPFWKAVISLTEQIRKAYASRPKSCPPEAAQFCAAIEDIRQDAETAERHFANKLSTEITKSARLLGAVKLKREYSEWKIASVQGGGFQMYSYLLANWHDWELPAWTMKKACRLTGLHFLAEEAVNFLNGLRKKRRYEACVSDGVPQSIQEAILGFANTALVKAPKSGSYASAEWITISFSYDRRGLNLWLSAVSSDFHGADDTDHHYCLDDISGFRGFSRTQRWRLRRIFDRANTFFKHTTRWYTFNSEFWEFIKGTEPSLIYPSGRRLESSQVDSLFKWYSVDALCETSCAAEHQKVKLTRDAIGNYLKQLQGIALIADSLDRQASKWKLKLAFPEILDDGTHMLSFESLFPIHLIGQIPADQLIPVGPICLNGQMLGFTGQNAGGKTVTMETIIIYLYMTLSGLPVFGVKVRLNPKKAIGLMFLERGDGSTFQLQLQKAKRILEATQETEPNAMVLFLDEVGTGTVQMDGFDFGKRLLQSLQKSSPSIVFSTQIPELAHFAEGIGARCYAFSLDHTVKPGIGASGAEELIRREGLDSLLSETPIH